MRRKLSGLKRRKPFIAQRQRFILISEGKNTELAYFEALKGQYPSALIAIEYVGPAGTPISIKNKVAARMAELRQEQRNNPSAKADTVGLSLIAISMIILTRQLPDAKVPVGRSPIQTLASRCG